MRHQHMAQAGGEADGGFCGEILRRNRAGKAHKAQRSHHQHHPDNVRPVPAEDAAVDNGGDDQRDEQLKGRFKHLKQRRKHAFAAVALEVDEEFFQTDAPTLLISIPPEGGCNHFYYRSFMPVLQRSADELRGVYAKRCFWHLPKNLDKA